MTVYSRSIILCEIPLCCLKCNFFFSHDHLSLLCMILPIFPSRIQQMNILYVCLSVCLSENAFVKIFQPRRFSSRSILPDPILQPLYTSYQTLSPITTKAHGYFFNLCTHSSVTIKKISTRELQYLTLVEVIRWYCH